MSDSTPHSGFRAAQLKLSSQHQQANNRQRIPSERQQSPTIANDYQQNANNRQQSPTITNRTPTERQQRRQSTSSLSRLQSMALPALAVGATLFLRPEDTAQDVGEGFYARVVSLHDDEALFEPLGAGNDVGNESILARVATARQVPDGDRVGPRVSTWLRCGVAFFDDDSVHFGQVTNTSELGIEIFSSSGLQWKTRADVVCLVSPLYAMLMFDLAVPPGTWTSAFISETAARLDRFLAEVDECPSVCEAMAAIAGLAEHSPEGELREWRDARSGAVRTTTTDHALRYTYYVAGGRDVPETLRAIVGASIADDPVSNIAAQVAKDVRPKSKRPRLHSAYLASETSYDGHDDPRTREPPRYSFVEALAAASSERPGPAMQNPGQGRTQPIGAGARGRSTASGLHATMTATAQRLQAHPTPSAEAVTPAQAAAVLRARLSDNHELLNLLRLATSSTEHDDDNSNRGKGMHKPSSAIRRLHEFVTAPEFQGTSAHSFVLRVAASRALQCFPYPSVIALLYHLGFGRPGLSMMHLCSITLLESMALQESNPVNMMDYGLNVAVPVARQAKNWADVQDAANGFVSYANIFSDATTAQLAASIARFVSAMQSMGHWPESHLPVLVFWINGRLEAYRGLVDQVVHQGVGDPSVAITWFNPSNPDLVPLQNVMIRSEINALQGTRQQHPSHRPQQHQNQTRPGATAAAPAWTPMPAEVTAAIPSRNNQDLCLRFASRRGCRVSGSTCGVGARTRGHFVDRSLPRVVRSYIVTKFGGLSADYSDAN